MRALTWHGKEDIRCETVPDPAIQDGRDAVIKVSACAICGSDLHLMGGFVPTVESGDVMGHECMGEVVEVGRDNTKLKVGERVVVPFTITHRVSLEDGPDAYKTFRDKQDGCVKVVMRPNG